MYDSMSELQAPETVMINLSGQVKSINVGVMIPFKKTAAFTSPTNLKEF